MIYLESFCYSFIFLCNKYTQLSFTECILNYYEKNLINKYLSKKEISHSYIPEITKNELTQSSNKDLSFKKKS